MDVSAAYPEGAACESLRRTFKVSGSRFSIVDDVAVSQRTAADKEYFMTPCLVEKERPGVLLLSYKDEVSVRVRYSRSLSLEVEQVDLKADGSSIPKYWGPTINRLVFSSPDSAPLKNTYKFEFEILK